MRTWCQLLWSPQKMWNKVDKSVIDGSHIRSKHKKYDPFALSLFDDWFIKIDGLCVYLWSLIIPSWYQISASYSSIPYHFRQAFDASPNSINISQYETSKLNHYHWSFIEIRLHHIIYFLIVHLQSTFLHETATKKKRNSKNDLWFNPKGTFPHWAIVRQANHSLIPNHAPPSACSCTWHLHFADAFFYFTAWFGRIAKLQLR